MDLKNKYCKNIDSIGYNCRIRTLNPDYKDVKLHGRIVDFVNS